MIIDQYGSIMTQSGHESDNWMGEGWDIVPKEFEALAEEYSPFVIVTRNKKGQIKSIQPDPVAREAWEAEKADGTDTRPAPTMEDIMQRLDALENAQDEMRADLSVVRADFGSVSGFYPTV